MEQIAAIFKFASIPELLTSRILGIPDEALFPGFAEYKDRFKKDHRHSPRPLGSVFPTYPPVTVDLLQVRIVKKSNINRRC